MKYTIAISNGCIKKTLKIDITHISYDRASR